MQECSDTSLLRQYADENSEAAFSALVTRHVNMVYSAALRKAGSPAAAEEITQAVFVILAKKADQLSRHPALSGWLYQATRLTAANYLRTEIRRARREQEAFMQSLSNQTESEVWPQIVPLLEDAMGRLGEKDRNAIALRFFEGKSFQEIGVAFGASENAAKKRVLYALEKLRAHFIKHGVTSTTATIAGAISANSVQAAPAALAKTATAVALTKGATASISTSILIQGTLKIMAWTKTQTVIVGAVVASLTTVSVIQHRAQSKLQAQNESLQQQINQLAQLKTENENLANQLATANRSEADARAQLRNLSQKPSQPVPAAAPAPSPAAPPPAPVKTAAIELPKSSWTNAGFATPEAVLQTRGAAVLSGDRELFKQSIFITDDARKFAEDALIRMAEASNAPNKTQYIQDIVDNKLGVDEAILMPLMALNQNGGLNGYKILSEQPVSPNEKLLTVETALNSGVSQQAETLDFQLIDGNWRIVYDKATLEKMMQH